MAIDAPAGFERYVAEAVPQAAPGMPGKKGEIELGFAHEGGRTRLVRDYARVPFHLSGTLDHDPHPEAATVYVQSPTGGVAQGDRLETRVRVDSDAIGVVSTQSASKIQSMERNYAAASVSLDVERSGHLEYVPEPTILHENARFSRETTLTVAENASAILGEVVVGGRLARGERFDFERYRSDLRVESGGQLLLADAADLRPDESSPGVPGVCAEFPVYGTLYVLAPDEDEAARSALSDRLHERVADAESESVRSGGTLLPNGAGVMVRVLSARAEQATATLHAAWDGARRALLGVGAPETRRY